MATMGCVCVRASVCVCCVCEIALAVPGPGSVQGGHMHACTSVYGRVNPKGHGSQGESGRRVGGRRHAGPQSTLFIYFHLILFCKFLADARSGGKIKLRRFCSEMCFC